MEALLRGVSWIDALNRRIGRAMAWPILGAILVSAGNAVSRKLFGASSNAWLEIQWHLFAVAALGCGGYVLLVNEHVRVDAWSSRCTPRTRAWIDLIALAVAGLPMCLVVGVMSAQLFLRRWDSGETYVNAGGLPVWPVVLVMPVGMALLALQCLGEMVRRVAFLRGFLAQPESTDSEAPSRHAGSRTG